MPSSSAGERLACHNPISWCPTVTATPGRSAGVTSAVFLQSPDPTNAPADRASPPSSSPETALPRSRRRRTSASSTLPKKGTRPRVAELFQDAVLKVLEDPLK